MKEKSPRRYRTYLAGIAGVAALIGAYIGLYSSMLTSHDSQMQLAADLRNSLMQRASTAIPVSFVTAMKEFGPTQNKVVYVKPHLLEPWNWWEETQPNVETLLEWARTRLDKCRKSDCSTNENHRILLRGADLEEAVLTKVDLYNSDLTGAYLSGADLTASELDESVLTRADLRGTNLTKASLKRTDLRRAKALNCDQLRAAKDWQLACRDEKLACGADIPKSKTCI